MAVKPNTARGLNSAQYIMNFLATIDAKIDGVALNARTYPDGSGNTTEDVIDYLATPWKKRPARDIRPNEDEAFHAANLLVKEVVRRVNRTKGRAEGMAKAAIRAKAAREAAAASAGGFRKAGKYLQRRMIARIEGGTLTTGGSAQQVDQEHYAPARERKYGIPTNVIFKRTGLLLSNLTGGTLRLHRKGT